MRDRRAIEAAQWDRLQVLRQALLGQNKFCSERLDTGFTSLAEFRARTPFTTKAELVEDQLAHPPFGTNLTYPIERYTRFCQTSGTTGVPLRWLDTEESWDWMAHCWCRVFQSAGTTAEDRIFFAFSFGPFLGFWTAFDGAKKIGALAIPGGGMSSTARLRTIFDTRVTILCCTPTYAIRLGEMAIEEGFDLSQSAIRAVILAGEPGASVPGTRALLKRLWPGARIVDHHGMSETGPVSYECPKRTGVLHILEDEYIAEIVDPQTGEPLPDGQKGELVLTNLGRIAAPVIRYRTGDIVLPSPHGQCACGTHDVALEGGILARRDDMVVIRGVNVYPSAIEDVIRHCGGVAEYRVEIQTVRAMVELRLSVEPAPDADAHLAHRLEAALRDALGLRIPITLLEPGSLPRFEMKSRRWVHVKS